LVLFFSPDEALRFFSIFPQSADVGNASDRFGVLGFSWTTVTPFLILVANPPFPPFSSIHDLGLMFFHLVPSLPMVVILFIFLVFFIPND